MEILVSILLFTPSLILVVVATVVFDELGSDRGWRCIFLSYINIFVSVPALILWVLCVKVSDIPPLFVESFSLYAIITVYSMLFVCKCCREMKMKRRIGEMLYHRMRP